MKLRIISNNGKREHSLWKCVNLCTTTNSETGNNTFIKLASESLRDTTSTGLTGSNIQNRLNKIMYIINWNKYSSIGRVIPTSNFNSSHTNYKEQSIINITKLCPTFTNMLWKKNTYRLLKTEYRNKETNNKSKSTYINGWYFMKRKLRLICLLTKDILLSSRNHLKHLICIVCKQWNKNISNSK